MPYIPKHHIYTSYIFIIIGRNTTNIKNIKKY